ncbi:MAG TPA: tetratricopeptide repeat protein [Kribbellaceae bacterium]|nr:tetratricopeptide repeat protein [Kribbellaceae bacterium]
MSQSNFSRPGAIDLSSLSATPPGAAPQQGGQAGGSYVLDVTETSFQTDVIDRSLQAPVVVEFWSGRSPGSLQLDRVLSALTAEYAGKFLLARVDVDTNPGLAQAVGVQAVPMVIGVLRGQAVPLFQGTVDEPEARQYLDQLLTVAVANGITGRAEPVGAAPDPEEAEAAADARYGGAEQAVAAGDLDSAVAAYTELLSQDPNDTVAKKGLAGVELLRRTQDLPGDIRERAAANPDDVGLQIQAADLDLLGEHVEDAFSRLIRTVQQTAGDDRDAARKHLLELFDVVGADDPRVIKARQRLMAALF